MEWLVFLQGERALPVRVEENVSTALSGGKAPPFPLNVARTELGVSEDVPRRHVFTCLPLHAQEERRGGKLPSTQARRALESLLYLDATERIPSTRVAPANRKPNFRLLARRIDNPDSERIRAIR